MPYILPERRKKLEEDNEITGLISKIENVGELNYCITRLCNEYIGKINTNYQNLNSIIGVIESAKLEFYRRKVSPYEDFMIIKNGDL